MECFYMQKIYAGTNLNFHKTYTAFPATAWNAKLLLVGTGGKLAVNAISSGNTFQFNASPSETESLTAGIYKYQIRAFNDSETHTVEEGTVTVEQDFASLTVLENHAEKMLKAIEALLEGKVLTDQQEYSINGRSLKRLSIPELEKLRDRYMWEVTHQKRTANGFKTLPSMKVKK